MCRLSVLGLPMRLGYWSSYGLMQTGTLMSVRTEVGDLRGVALAQALEGVAVFPAHC